MEEVKGFESPKLYLPILRATDTFHVVGPPVPASIDPATTCTRSMSSAPRGSLMVMPSYDLVIALPTADRSKAYAFAQAMGLDTPGEPAEDGVPEPLRVPLNERASVMYVPTGGFGWVTNDRPTADPGTSECLLSLQVGIPDEVDDLIGRVEAAGGRVVSGPEQKSWGYTGTFTDPDGHLWEAIVSAI